MVGRKIRAREPEFLIGLAREEVLLPEQIAPPIALADGERRLRAAVLDAAVADLRRFRGLPRPYARAVVAELREWFASRDQSWPFAFEPLCEAIGLDADAVRAGLAREA